MFSSPVLSGFLVFVIVALTTFAYSAEAEGQTLVKIITTDDVSKLKNLPQGAQLIPMSQGTRARGSFRYSVGQRVSNDRIISQGADSSTWNSPQNVQLTVQQPENALGDVITYVQIDVMQGSNEGRAYVAAGGIGQRFITVVVEANNVRNFSYAYNIWGI